MTTRELAGDRGRRLARRDLLEIGEELRTARMSLGASQARVAAACGTSPSTIGRTERAVLDPGFELLAAHAAVLGLRARIRLFPDGDPLRDQAQLALLAALKRRLPPGVGWRTEVPLPLVGDRRAWDAVAMLDEGWVAIEAETRIADAQATQRRIELKRRDDPRIARVVILVADTARNREALASPPAPLRAAYPLGTREVLAALSRGRVPVLDGIVALRDAH